MRCLQLFPRLQWPGVAQMCYHKQEHSYKQKAVKTTKKPVNKRKTIPKISKKAAAPRARPLHKKILLHPFSVMVLLCVGVILAGSTYHGIAANYDVTATVQAPPATTPAVIAQPYD